MACDNGRIVRDAPVSRVHRRDTEEAMEFLFSGTIPPRSAMPALRGGQVHLLADDDLAGEQIGGRGERVGVHAAGQRRQLGEYARVLAIHGEGDLLNPFAASALRDSPLLWANPTPGARMHAVMLCRMIARSSPAPPPGLSASVTFLSIHDSPSHYGESIGCAYPPLRR